MSTEADTYRKFVVSKLQAAGWDSDPHSIAEQRSFTDGRIIVRSNIFIPSEAREILNDPLRDQVNENIGKFGRADQLRNAVNQLKSLLYAV